MNFLENLFSKYPKEKVMKWFHQVCFAEAISWFLLFVGMIWIREDEEGILPLTYIIIIGNVHGLFFTLYLLLAFPARKFYKWDDEDSIFALLAAFFPLATIWIEKKLARFDRE